MSRKHQICLRNGVGISIRFTRTSHDTLSPETLLCSTGLITVGFRPFLLIPGWEIGPLLFNQTTTTVQVKPVPIWFLNEEVVCCLKIVCTKCCLYLILCFVWIKLIHQKKKKSFFLSVTLETTIKLRGFYE